MAFLPTVALDLGHGHSLNPGRGERVTDFVELEWFDDGDNHFHVVLAPPRDRLRQSRPVPGGASGNSADSAARFGAALTRVWANDFEFVHFALNFGRIGNARRPIRNRREKGRPARDAPEFDDLKSQSTFQAEKITLGTAGSFAGFL